MAQGRGDWVLKRWPDEELVLCFAVLQRTTHLLDPLAAELLVRLEACPLTLDQLVADVGSDDAQTQGELFRNRVLEALAALQGIDLVGTVP